MQNFQPKTNAQLGRIFGLAKKRDLDEDALRGAAARVSRGRVDRLSLLSFDEANDLIKDLGGDPFPFRVVPRRTENYHRQQCGVPQIAQPGHLALMDELAAGRGIGPEGLERMCRRMLRGVGRPRTTGETNKIIEALKAMNARDAAKEAA